MIMLDELAQYATRFQAAQSAGGEQLAAFLMRLHGYARDHSGIAVVLTLAGSSDAFAKQTKKIADIVSKVKGQEVDESQAMAMAQDAQSSIKSVVARDATTAIPVHAKELTNVLSKRLFSSINGILARDTIETYVDMYKLHSATLPDNAGRDDFHQDLLANYPFHPNFIRFLNEKLATIENFQGTRGVLRTLALVVRNIWAKKRPIPMIHTCHVDLQDPYIVSELVGRTEGGDLLAVLNADVGGPDTTSLSLGRSHAQQADLRNPHPMGFPLYEYTWRTVFLHSLVGRSEGLGSNLFGILKKDALFSIAFPQMTPPQVETALEEIEISAMYLKNEHGKYFASLEPTINKPLMDIRASLKGSDAVQDEIAAAARKVVGKNDSTFRVITDVVIPEDVPDEGNKPILSLVSLTAETITAFDFMTTCGKNKKPRERQNLVFLLVPKTVQDMSEAWSDLKKKEVKETMERIEGLCQTVMAMRILKRNPENYGIKYEKLIQNDFDKRLKERELALSTIVTQSYNSVWFSSASGQILRKEILTGGGEGGAAVIEQIKKTLIDEGELISRSSALTLEILTGLDSYFFEKTETPLVHDIRLNFSCKRNWPILEDIAQLDSVLREGVKRGKWCAFKMAGMESMKPDEFFCNETGMPLDVDLNGDGWTLLKPHGAKKRGWWPSKIDDNQIEVEVKKVLASKEAVTVEQIVDGVCQEYGDIPSETILRVAEKMIKQGNFGAFSGSQDQDDKPQDLVLGKSQGKSFILKPGQVVVTPAHVAKKGWKTSHAPEPGLNLSGKEVTKKVYSLLDRLGGLYNKGATSTIDFLDLTALEIPGGGRMTITLEDVSPEAMKTMDEFFDILKNTVSLGTETDISLEIKEIDEACLLVKQLR